MNESPKISVEHRTEEGRVWVQVRGTLDRHGALLVFDHLKDLIHKQSGSVGLDLGEVDFLDSAGAAMLLESMRLAGRRGCRLEMGRMSEPVTRTLSMFRFKGAQTAETPRQGMLEGLGTDLVNQWQVLQRLIFLMADTFYWALIGPFMVGQGSPPGELTRQAVLLGSRAFGIVALISFLTGITLTLLSAQQLRQFGANIFAANLVAVAMVREMGPMMTAIIVAGRSGSAIAAEIATMRVTEEVDALEVMGFSPIRFLVVPKLYAVTWTQPLLTVISVVFGILGGLVIAALMLGVPASVFIHQASEALEVRDLVNGLAKSLVFGWLILLVGAFCGLETKGGAEAVGLSTTRSVVLSIFAVIVADLVFSLAFYM